MIRLLKKEPLKLPEYCLLIRALRFLQLAPPGPQSPEHNCAVLSIMTHLGHVPVEAGGLRLRWLMIDLDGHHDVIRVIPQQKPLQGHTRTLFLLTP